MRNVQDSAHRRRTGRGEQVKHPILRMRWQPGRMVLRLPLAMRLADKVVAYDSAMIANEAIERMMQVDIK